MPGPEPRFDDLIDRILGRRLSMVSAERLKNLVFQASVAKRMQGAFVECGVARGGCLALMAAVSGGANEIWGFDSFERMPELTDEDLGEGQLWVGVKCAGPKGPRAPDATFAALDVAMSRVRIVPGWFEDTLPSRRQSIGPIALLRIDCDWYRATRFCLETLYDLVMPGGVVLIDDYFTFRGCRAAVDGFLDEHERGGVHLFATAGGDEAYWYKPPGA